MSDAAIATIVTGFITVSTMVVGLLTLWIKVKYGVDEAKKAAKEAKTAVATAETAVRSVEDKIDFNTSLTAKYGESAADTNRHVNECNESDRQIVEILKSYGDRITRNEAMIQALEVQMTAVMSSAATVSKEVTTTRHEVRGHLQTVMNKLDVLHLSGMSLPRANEHSNEKSA